VRKTDFKSIFGLLKLLVQLPFQNSLVLHGKFAFRTKPFVKLKPMSLTEMQDIYGALLKRYKEFGFLHPEDALNHDIRLLETHGKTTGEEILHGRKGTTDETIKLIERYIAMGERTLKPKEEKTQPTTSKSKVQKKTDEIRAIAQ
jgi:hypothetical protein